MRMRRTARPYGVNGQIVSTAPQDPRTFRVSDSNNGNESDSTMSDLSFLNDNSNSRLSTLHNDDPVGNMSYRRYRNLRENEKTEDWVLYGISVGNACKKQRLNSNSPTSDSPHWSDHNSRYLNKGVWEAIDLSNIDTEVVDASFGDYIDHLCYNGNVGPYTGQPIDEGIRSDYYKTTTELDDEFRQFRIAYNKVKFDIFYDNGVGMSGDDLLNDLCVGKVSDTFDAISSKSLDSEFSLMLNKFSDNKDVRDKINLVRKLFLMVKTFSNVYFPTDICKVLKPKKVEYQVKTGRMLGVRNTAFNRFNMNDRNNSNNIHHDIDSESDSFVSSDSYGNGNHSYESSADNHTLSDNDNNDDDTTVTQESDLVNMDNPNEINRSSAPSPNEVQEIINFENLPSVDDRLNDILGSNNDPNEAIEINENNEPSLEEQIQALENQLLNAPLPEDLNEDNDDDIQMVDLTLESDGNDSESEPDDI